MHDSIIRTKVKEIEKELSPCLTYYAAKYPEKHSSGSSTLQADRLIFQEVLRIVSYLEAKEKQDAYTFSFIAELLNEIFKDVKWNSESLRLALEEDRKKNPDHSKIYDEEDFLLPEILQVAGSFDEEFFSEKYEIVRNFLYQIVNLIIKADGKITPVEEEFLKKYNSRLESGKKITHKPEAELVADLTRIYSDFFDFSAKKEAKEFSTPEKLDKTKSDSQKTEKSKTEEKPKPEESPVSLEDLMKELGSLVGLSKVKEDINTLVNMLKVEQLRKDKGFTIPDKSLHIIFTGNPGTGKTTIARILAKIYKAIGLLAKGHLVETDRSGLVAGFVGQTAIKTMEICNSALDGVLFIDEAYALAEGGDNDFGKEAINTLLKFMEDNRAKIIIIVAGYTGNMEEFIAKNPGLKSRFNRYIHFDDYKPEELLEIFERTVKKTKLILNDNAKKKALEIFTKEYETRDEKFGNGRFARNLFEKVYMNQANRIVKLTEMTDEVLCTITEEDF